LALLLRQVVHVVIVIVIVAASCGCGGTQSRHDGPSRTVVNRPIAARPKSDRERVRLGLLPAADMPRTVTEQSPKRNRASCGPRVIFRHVATALATSPRYGLENGRVQQTVALFRTAKAAARAFATMNTPASQRCFQRYAGQEVEEEARAPVRDITSQILNVERRGQRSTAYRMNVVVEAGVETRVAVDILLNQIGRSTSSVSVIWTRIPRDIEFQEALVTKIAARLQRLLG
jgi:hypothetical protein